MNLIEYVQPELVVLIPALWGFGQMLKYTTLLKNEYIPAILGVSGIILSMLYICGTSGVSATSVFAGITQGLISASIAVYGHEVVKNAKRLKHD